MNSSSSPDPSAGPIANTCGRLDAAWEVLRQIPDPEVPVISLCELGIVRGLRETAAGLEVVLTRLHSLEFLIRHCRASVLTRREITLRSGFPN